MYAHTHMRTCTHMHAHECTQMHTCILIRACRNACKDTCTHAHKHPAAAGDLHLYVRFDMPRVLVKTIKSPPTVALPRSVVVLTAVHALPSLWQPRIPCSDRPYFQIGLSDPCNYFISIPSPRLVGNCRKVCWMDRNQDT